MKVYAVWIHRCGRTTEGPEAFALCPSRRWTWGKAATKAHKTRLPPSNEHDQAARGPQATNEGRPKGQTIPEPCPDKGAPHSTYLHSPAQRCRVAQRRVLRKRDSYPPPSRDSDAPANVIGARRIHTHPGPQGNALPAS